MQFRWRGIVVILTIWENEPVVWREYLEVEKGEKSSLKLDVRYQACDANRCLAPRSVAFELEL